MAASTRSSRPTSQRVAYTWTTSRASCTSIRRQMLRRTSTARAARRGPVPPASSSRSYRATRCVTHDGCSASWGFPERSPRRIRRISMTRTATPRHVLRVRHVSRATSATSARTVRSARIEEDARSARAEPDPAAPRQRVAVGAASADRARAVNVHVATGAASREGPVQRRLRTIATGVRRELERPVPARLSRIATQGRGSPWSTADSDAQESR